MSTADSRSEYSQVSVTRHDEGALRSRSSRLRLAYFGAASFWGFVVGSIAVFAALQAGGGPAVRAEANSLLYLIPAALIAVGGGILIARAYRDAKRGK